MGLVGLLIVVADQLSKSWIRSNLDSGQSLFDIGFLRIIHIHNTGAAFGIFQDYTAILSIIALIGVIIILLLVFVWHRQWSFLDSMLFRIGIGLVLGGAIGNLIDRVFRGSVTDFIDFKVWPAFNVADSAVTVGAIIIALRVLFLARSADNQE